MSSSCSQMTITDSVTEVQAILKPARVVQQLITNITRNSVVRLGDTPGIAITWSGGSSEEVNKSEHHHRTIVEWGRFMDMVALTRPDLITLTLSKEEMQKFKIRYKGAIDEATPLADIGEAHLKSLLKLASAGQKNKKNMFLFDGAHHNRAVILLFFFLGVGGMWGR